MIIKFKKAKEGHSTLSCLRSDNSTTWTKLHPGLEIHDFAHYVVETELGYANAFYGLVARGFDIGDFELPGDQRPLELVPSNLPVQALQTEHIVNLLQIAFAHSGDSMELLGTLRTILREKGLPYPGALNESRLKRIRRRLDELISQWNHLPAGDSIELLFDVSVEQDGKT